MCVLLFRMKILVTQFCAQLCVQSYGTEPLYLKTENMLSNHHITKQSLKL